MSDFTQKLTIQAEGVGLPETARGLELVELAEKKLLETQKALEQARLTGTLDDVEELAKQEQKLTQAISAMTGRQDQATASNVNFGEQLRKIHPLLGDVVSALSKYSGVAGMVGAALAALTAGFKAMGEAAQAATNDIRENANALTGIKGKDRDTQQSIENIRAGTRMGPFASPEESDAASSRARDIRAKFGFLGESAVNEAVALASAAEGTDAVGTVGSEMMGPPSSGDINVSTKSGFSTEQTARIARMLEVPRMARSLGISDKTSQSGIVRKLRRGLQKFGPELDQTFRLEEQQRLSAGAMASGQVGRDGGSSLELRDVIARHAPAGSNIDFLVELAQHAGNAKGLEELDSRLATSDKLFGIPQLIGRGVDALVPGPSASPIFRARRSDTAILRSVFQELHPPVPSPTLFPTELEMEQRERIHRLKGLPGIGSGGGGGNENTGMAGPPAVGPGMAGPIVYNDNRSYNGRNYGPDGRSQQARIRNGESRARDMENV